MKNKRKVSWVEARQSQRSPKRQIVKLIDMPDDAITNYVSSMPGRQMFTPSGYALPKDSHIISNTVL